MACGKEGPPLCVLLPAPALLAQGGSGLATASGDISLLSGSKSSRPAMPWLALKGAPRLMSVPPPRASARASETAALALWRLAFLFASASASA